LLSSIILRPTAKVFADRRGHGFATAPPPGREQINHLLTLAFAASLEHEEGRTVAFTLFYDETAQLIDYVFKQPPLLTAGTLARLSAALDPSQTYICVTAEGSKLVIVGFRHWGDHYSFRAPMSAPSHFTIRVVGPGILVVRYDAHLVLTYRQGEVAFYPGNFDWLNDARRALYLPVLPYEDEGHNGQVQRCVEHIAECMLRLGHGGALLILPEGIDWEARVASCAFAPVQPAARIRDAVLKRMRQQRALIMRRLTAKSGSA
jgi:Probable sensor domain DACNV